MKRILVSICLLAAAVTANAQQDGMYSNHLFSMQEFNPAYVGIRGVMSGTIMHRSQWLGLEGAPNSEFIAVNSPLPFYKLSGGFSLSSDRIGPLSTTSLALDAARDLRISEKSFLRYGIKFSGIFSNANFAELNLTDGNDALFASNMKSKLAANVGFGALYFYDKFYVGISSPRMANRKYKASNQSDMIVLQTQRQICFNGGAILPISKDILLRPTFLTRITTGAPVSLDLSTTAVYKDRFWLGLMGRFGDALGISVGGNVIDALQVGYAFDASIGGVSGYTSHEIVVRYDMPRDNQKLVSTLRYF
ncbi:MAG: type IX secretion system membrane protein PorP/SprF [Flavobacteriales bacterium]